MLPTYEDLTDISVRQFMFIFPDNKVFMRFHNLKRFGDDVTDIRYSVKMANSTKQKTVGFEEGRTYNGFRNVFPVFHKNKYLGVIEISFSFAIRYLFAQEGEQFNFMINKDIVNLKLFKDEREQYVPSYLSDDYLHEKNFLAYGKDSSNILKQIDISIREEIAERYVIETIFLYGDGNSICYVGGICKEI